MTDTPIVQVPALPGSRLEDLLATYADLKPRADELAGQLESVKTAIKVELQVAAPDARKIDVQHAALAQPLRLSYVEGWRFDSKALKADNPALYVQYAKQSGKWELRGVSA